MLRCTTDHPTKIDTVKKKFLFDGTNFLLAKNYLDKSMQANGQLH